MGDSERRVLEPEIVLEPPATVDRGGGPRRGMAAPPARIDGGRDQADDALAPNTVSAYRRNWRQYLAWIGETGLDPYATSTVYTWLGALGDKGASRSKITQARAAVRHHLPSFDLSPAAAARFARQARGIGRARAAAGQAPRQAPAIPVPALRQMIRHLPETLRGRRDRVLLLLGFAIGRRASELAALRVADVAPAGEDGLLVTIRRSKVDQEGAGSQSFVPAHEDAEVDPVRSLRAWISASRLRPEDPLLPSMRGRVADRITEPLRPMSRWAVTDAIRRAALAAGIENATNLSGHSLRRSMATSAARNGAPPAWITAQGGWSERSTVVMQYVKLGRTMDRQAAGWIFGN